MNERTLWAAMRKAVEPYAVLVRVESPISPGIPDVAYCIRGCGASGWLELKYLKAWPTRPASTVNIPTLTREQVLFAETWHGAGGRAALLLQVGYWYGLLPPAAMRAVLDRQLTQAQMAGFTLGVGETTVFPAAALVARLRK